MIGFGSSVFYSFSLSLIIVLLAFIQAGSLSAQNRYSFPAAYTFDQIRIDGIIDENEWQNADPVSGFVQLEPVEGEPSSRQTEVRVLFGENNLFIGARLFDDTTGIENALGRRDEYNRADWFIVSIDSYLNRRIAYTFGVSAAGVQIDGQRTGTQMVSAPGGGRSNLPPGLDNSWDAIWQSAIRINDLGWDVEISIPYSMLRFSHAENQSWGIHFTRRIARLGEISEWPLVSRTERTNLVANFGLITDIRNLEPRRNIQIRPYILSGMDTGESISTPGKTTYNYNYDIGGDLKIGLGPNIILDATINPDFGQVESDPAVLNLTAFETIYPEKRPFFIEGADIFDFSLGPGSMFYSRRIGDHEPIIGAAKLSGRTSGGLSLGILGASSGHSFDPSMNYGIGRVSQQLGRYSSVGGIIAGIAGTPEGFLNRRESLAGGIDWDLRNTENTYGIAGHAAFTRRVNGIQDARHENGYTGRLEFNKRQGSINGVFALLIFSDEFNPNDLGQLRESNFYEAMTSLNYEINGGQPFGPFQRANAGLFMLQRYSFDENMDLGERINLSSEWITNNFQVIEAGVSMNNMFDGYDPYETRGMGPWARPYLISYEIDYNTDQRKNWQLSPDFVHGFTGDGGRTYELGLRGNSNIGNRLTISWSLSGGIENRVTAWASNEVFLLSNDEWMTGIISTHPDNLNPDDYEIFEDNGELNAILSGVRPVNEDAYYLPVFGKRDIRSVDLTVRGSYTISPDLSLQIYSQIFTARGMYDDFGILVSPEEIAPFNSYPKRSEFSYKSLLSNLVLRWEHRPGSTLFFVWSHGRRERDELNPLYPWGSSPYDRSTVRQLGDVFSVFPGNSFIIKINYTFL